MDDLRRKPHRSEHRTRQGVSGLARPLPGPGALAGDPARPSRLLARDELVAPFITTLDRSELVDDAAGALFRYGNAVIPEIERTLRDDGTPQDVRREVPALLVRIGTAEAEQSLIGSLLQADVTLRHRLIASLNKLRTIHPEVSRATCPSSLRWEMPWRSRSSAG